MPIYCARLELIQAVQLLPENEEELLIFLSEANQPYEVPNMVDDSLTLVLRSINGDQICNEGDYVMYNANGEVLVVEKMVFEATYELDFIPPTTKEEIVSDESTNPDQTQEDERERELAEEREHRETVLGSSEERAEDSPDPVETAFPGPAPDAPPSEVEPDLALEEEVAQEPDPAGTTSEDS